jgi:Helix-turn-helix domain
VIDQPLAAACQRLRGKPGRPRKVERDGLEVQCPHVAASSDATLQGDVPENVPRLLDVQAAAKYLSVSVWTIRDLEAAGELRRVRLPLGRSEVRRLLFDRRDLDRLVDRCRDPE